MENENDPIFEIVSSGVGKLIITYVLYNKVNDYTNILL